MHKFMYVTKAINLRKHMKADSRLTVKLELNGSYFREYYYGDTFSQNLCVWNLPSESTEQPSVRTTALSTLSHKFKVKEMEESLPVISSSPIQSQTLRLEVPPNFPQSVTWLWPVPLLLPSKGPLNLHNFFRFLLPCLFL